MYKTYSKLQNEMRGEKEGKREERMNGERGSKRKRLRLTLAYSKMKNRNKVTRSNI